MELGVADAAVLDEGMDIVPVGLVLFALGVHQAVELVRHLLGDVGGELSDIPVVLQEAAADVQRQIGAIQHAAQQQQELRDDLLDVIGHEHLAVEQLDLPLLTAEILADTGEVQDALEVEGIVHVQVNPEQRLLKGVEQLAVGILIFFLGAVAGIFQPQRMGIVDRLGCLGRRRFLALFGSLLGSLFGFLGLELFILHIHQIDGHGHVAAVALQHLAHAQAIQEFLFFIRDMQRHGGAALGAVAVAHLIGHAVLAFPAHRLGPFLIGQRIDRYLISGHKGRIEAQAEVADDAAILIPLILFQKLLGAGEGHLVDVAVYLLSRHADAVIGETKLLGLGIHGHGDAQVFIIACDHAILGHRVAAVGRQLTDKDILIGIQPALNHRHDIFSMDGNIAFFHIGHCKNLPAVCDISLTTNPYYTTKSSK